MAPRASPRSMHKGGNFVDDVGVGDLWYFPGGIPHSIQGLGPDGCEFLLVFDDGDFDEDSTFLLSDWFKHVPNDVLGKNFGVPATLFGHTPGAQRALHLQGAGARTARPRQAAGRIPVGRTSATVCWRRSRSGRRAERCASPIPSVFPRSQRPSRRRSWRSSRADAGTALASQHRRMAVLHRGRGPHGRVRRVGPGANLRFPGRRCRLTCRSPWATTWRTPAPRRCASWRCSRAATTPIVSLNQWMALTPPELVSAHLKLGPQFMGALRKDKVPVVPA
jgi:oxalate decarboxylase